jgi:hypothetical protein
MYHTPATVNSPGGSVYQQVKVQKKTPGARIEKGEGAPENGMVSPEREVLTPQGFKSPTRYLDSSFPRPGGFRIAQPEIRYWYPGGP